MTSKSQRMRQPQPRKDRAKRPTMIRVMSSDVAVIPRARRESGQIAGVNTLHLPLLRLTPLDPEDVDA